jgi:hypothetical protein
MDVDPSSVLLITLDSCRFDTFEEACVPNLRRIATPICAMAPGNFTYASHAAMFVGFTPGVAEVQQKYVNPKYGRIFRMGKSGAPGAAEPWMTLSGRNIIDGFGRLGYKTIGTGAVRWFDPATPTARALISDFSVFFHTGAAPSLRAQVAFVLEEIEKANAQPFFVFMNIGETHTPYHYDGASWSDKWNPCDPFGDNNDVTECRERQRRCLEFVDRELEPILALFTHANVIACGDHGDAWGEDGLWEHGIHHPAVYRVPLLVRLNEGPPT